MKIACVAWLVILSVSVLTAQTTGSWENGSWGRVYSSLMKRGHGIVGFPQIIAIPNKPFTATSIYTDQRMENGKNVGDPITAECTIARDDKGRIHAETAFESIEEGKLVIGGFDIYILDPVAHSWSRYFARADHSLPLEPTAKLRKPKLSNYWNPRDFVIVTEPEPTDPPKDQDEENDSPATQESNTKNNGSDPTPLIFIPTKDNLPVQWVDGISAVIKRTIMKYGDKQQFVQISEEWLSPDYGIVIRNTDLRESLGIQTVEIKDIVPGPPDPTLFKIPPGYVIELEH